MLRSQGVEGSEHFPHLLAEAYAGFFQTERTHVFVNVRGQDVHELIAGIALQEHLWRNGAAGRIAPQNVGKPPLLGKIQPGVPK